MRLRSSAWSVSAAKSLPVAVQGLGAVRFILGDSGKVSQRSKTYSTVTDFARLRGLSTSVPFCKAA